MKELKPLVPVIGVFIVIVILFVWGIMSRNRSAVVTYVPNTQVACLPSGHQNLAVHIHPVMSITVDGAPETLPANIGVTPGCMAEIHTHEADGVIHVETISTDRLTSLSLADFFAVWGQPIERDGFTYTLTVDGATVADPSTVTFADGQAIALSYTSSR